MSVCRWFYCCCCCCLRNPTRDKGDGSPGHHALDDSSSLIQEAAAVEGQHPFYVPRRHSSFNTSTYNTVSRQPCRSQSDSCSSSGEDEVPEQRGRCWSTIPATTDVAAIVANGVKANSIHNFRPITSQDSSDSVKSHLVFDKHPLSEIKESDRDEGDNHVEDEEKTTIPSDEVHGYLSFATSYDDEEQNPLMFDKHPISKIEKSDHDYEEMTTSDEVSVYLSFVTHYNDEKQKLSVFLDRATSLPKKSSSPDPQHYSTFVKLSLLITASSTSKKNFVLSRTARNTLSPVFREEHFFHTNRTKWKSSHQSALRLSLFESDRQGRHDAVGHVLLPLTQIGDRQEQHCLPLTPISTPVVKNISGQLLVSLFYSALQSRLSVHVIKARHLRLDPESHKRHIRPLNKGKESFDSFVKVTLMCGGQKVKTNRSLVATGDPVPSYNHKSDFVVPQTFLTESSLVVTVVAKGVLGRSIPIGRVTAGPYVETGNGIATHWGRMVQETRSVVQWRNLYL
ncbi:hypothetical protein JTE90_012585 [Oedothorax gibbosus]|uniref:C2 domain-containing protein n=1 Tax=Oedothorax gibbosus TaxID=931172 RepID=A0AAV6V1W4_9ARAC|nr:hypothetical protein JTE90_012585 [Oedothorax gibbosus]